MFPVVHLIHKALSRSSVFLSLSSTKKLHALIILTQLSADPFYFTQIVRLYSFHGQLWSARKVFDESPNRSVFLWNAIVRAYAKAREFRHAFLLFGKMLRTEDNKPDNFTFACLVRACSERLDVHGLRIFHARALVSGLGQDFVCSSSLVTAYSRLRLVDEASKVFSRVTEPDLVLCNAMISAYGNCGFWDESLRLFNLMRGIEKNPDGFTLVGLLLGFEDSSSVNIGECVHGFCLKTGFNSNVHVSSSLMSMYSKFNSTSSLHKVFSEIAIPDLVQWTSLITGFSHTGDHRNAIFHFRGLTFLGWKPDSVLTASVLSIASRMANAKFGVQIHGYAFRHGLESDFKVCSSLVDMYSKSGLLGLGIRVFETIPHRNIVTYNAMILGFGLHGQASKAFDLFDKLLGRGIFPDEATFSALLCACCHSGLVEEGKRVFNRMSEFCIGARTEHYVHLVKLMGMNGRLEEAYQMTKSLPQPVDHGIWGALLSCCDACGDFKLAEIIAQKIIENDTKFYGSYKVMVSNMYASDGRWENAMKVREETVLKTPGISWIEGNYNENNSNGNCNYKFVH